MTSDRPLRKSRGGSLLGNDWEEKNRAKIQNGMMVKRLILYVNGKISLEPAQVTAAVALLKKVLPDLSQSENKTEVIHRYVARLPDKSETVDEWQKQHSQPTLQ
jgi:hypothetical protein